MPHIIFSRIISGTMNWGSWGRQLEKSDMVSLIHHCIENDITSFDHADIYGDHSTEAQFGNAFIESSIAREKVQFISKCGIVYPNTSNPSSVKHYNYSTNHIIKSVENSLKRLNTDYLDLFLLHRPSPLMHPSPIFEAITKLTQEGKIRDFGVSNFTPSQIDLISSEVPITVNQIEFSLTACDAINNGALDQMLLKKIVLMAWSPLGKVFKIDDEQTRRIKMQLSELTNKYNATEDQLLLAWIMMLPYGIHPVVGTTDKLRLKNANKAVALNLSLEDWFLILSACQGHKVP